MLVCPWVVALGWAGVQMELWRTSASYLLVHKRRSEFGNMLRLRRNIRMDCAVTGATVSLARDLE